MKALEPRALASFEPRPNVFLRYVDDCFCIIKRNSSGAFTEHLNGIEEAIKFTVEEEAESRLSLLDVLVERRGDRLSFKVYNKGTHTGRYLHFISVHPPVTNALSWLPSPKAQKSSAHGHKMELLI